MPVPSAAPRLVHHSLDLSVPLHYMESEGDGQPLMLLHGIGMDWRVWQAISRRLAPHFHLYLLDLRGHGGSGKPEHGYSLADYAADVEDLIDALDLKDVVLAGSSLGGAVAVAVEAPADLVTHRVLIDPPLTGGPVRDESMYRTILTLKHEPPSLLADFLGKHDPGAGRHLMEAMSAMWHGASDGVIIDMLKGSEKYFALDSALAAVESPTLLLQADPARGGVLTDAQAQRALSLLPQGRLVYLPGAGHAIHATKPVEFVRLLLEFTGRASGPDSHSD